MTENLVSWSSLFASVIWQLWKHRNEETFSGISRPLRAVFQHAYSWACCFDIASPSPTNARGSASGVLRDTEGSSIIGFSKHLGISSVLQSELWGIYEGLRLAWTYRVPKLEIQSDCAQVVRLIDSKDALKCLHLYDIAALVGKVKSIVLTGHSIGGSAASLSALWLLCHLQSTVSSPILVLCITFGSPLLGNEALHRSILRQRWSGNFCHVVSKHDIMPRLLLFNETVNHIPAIQSLLHFWHCCMTSSHAIVDGISSQLPQDLKTNVFQCVLKDLEVLKHAEDLSAKSLFWPLGSYVFCSREGVVCVENAASIIRMMYLMMAMFIKLLHRGSCMETISNPRENVAIMAKECLQMGKNDHRPNLTAANLAIRLSKIVPFRSKTEWYKACYDEADDQMGYYDSFKRKAGSRREARVNMNRHKLASFWDSVISLLENNKLPRDFDKGKWVNSYRFYMLLFEPLDITDYYRTGMYHERGHYIENRRQWRYEIFDKWWRIRSLQIEETRGVSLLV
ncbi:PAD4 [Hibiscus syriacus]|uniref:PAD4 n=1 Tax=Hibiscus syriacus TaxID=106335 RepID=A0A6A3B3T9_HIBSY|nr:PAD4 [Hibiscus syriacus]